MNFSRLVDVPPSATVAMNSLALEKKARGERVYNLSAGEPVLSPHPAIMGAAKRAIDEGKTGYPPVAGLTELRRAAAQWVNRVHATQFSWTNTLVAPGGKFAIFAACQALIEPGDEVVMIAPYWVSYPSIVSLFGGTPIIVSTTEAHGWIPLPEDIATACTEKTKLLILNSAGNPTGALYSRTLLEKILREAQRRGVTVLSDEVYSGLVYEGTFVSCGAFPEYRDSVAVVNSCSKNFAMTGWRVGFLFAPEELVGAATMISSQSTSGASTVSQYAALGAIEHAGDITASVCESMKARRGLFAKAGLPVAPAGLYSFAALASLGQTEQDSTVFCERLMRDYSIASVPGGAFGQEGYVRFAFGETEKELSEALEVLQRSLHFCA